MISKMNIVLIILGFVSIALGQQVIYIPQDYSTIQDGINGATPGDTIYVSPGTYVETLTIDKTLSIIGEDSLTTIIDGNYQDISVRILADCVTLRNFTIKNGCNETLCCGIKLVDADSCIISNNRILENKAESYWVSKSGYGIQLDSSNNNTILDNRISANEGISGADYEIGNGCGIFMYMSNFNTVSNCIVSNNVGGSSPYGAGSGCGILFRETNNNQILNCIVSGNDSGIDPATGDVGHGIYLNSSQYTLIANSIISENGHSNGLMGIGIQIQLGGYNKIMDNVITANNSYSMSEGLVLANTYPDTIVNNIIANHHSPHNWGIGIKIYHPNVIGGSYETSNRIYDNSLYNLANFSHDDIYVPYNYWGTDNPDTIDLYILDCNDDERWGCVYIDPYLDVEDFLDEVQTPHLYQLHQNYPNPFNPTTTIAFTLPRESFISLVIYNTAGQRVKTLICENKIAGNYSIIWDGKNEIGQIVNSGVYFYRIEIGQEYQEVRKMILLR